MLRKLKKWWNKPKVIIDQFFNGYQEGAKAYDSQMHDLRTYYMDQIAKLTEDTRKKELESWLVDPEYVFSIGKTGQILLNGEQISTPELKNLKAEVRALKEFQIWKVIQSTLRQKAIEKAVMTSTDLYSPKGNEQILAGKMMVFNLDVIKTIINDIDRASMK